MPRSSGVYSAPPGTTVAANTTIESAKYNAFVADLVADANAPRPVSAGGTDASTPDGALNSLGGTTVGKDVFRAATKAAARQAIGAELPAGAVAYFIMSAAPTGWLKANGAAVSRTTYADLFAAIGTSFGAGDGSTTFNVPDFRGEFIRSWDDGRGVDASRSMGSAQTAAMLNHTHTVTGNTNTTGSHSHTDGLSSYDPWGNKFGSTTAGALTQTAAGQQVSNRVNIFTSTDGDHSHTVTGTTGNPSAGGGTETRPRNIALLTCIKY